jgi:4'-phosphopantetheinyl transferase
MTSVLYSETNDISAEVFNQYLLQLPLELQQKNARYRNYADRCNHLFGKILLQKGIESLGYRQKNVLQFLKYNKFGRPSIFPDFDFNISHSGNLVICAISNDFRIGVDIEKIGDVHFEDVRNAMSTEQWEEIFLATDPLDLFFKYWTIKESALKADTRGLTLPLDKIMIRGRYAYIQNYQWNLTELVINRYYKSFLATSMQVNLNIKVRKIDLDETSLDQFC